MPKISFRELLSNKLHFIVPTIQRDYAQGRTDGAYKDLCEEVREDFIDRLYNALVNDKELVLDYVYGSDDGDVFYPIDGQQRLTTLFLLHWYIGKKECKTEDDSFKLLKRFTYEIRDASKEFCISLIDINIDLSSNMIISKQIKNNAKYHRIYDYDPTISSMLVMLDKIDEKFRNASDDFWDKLSKIKFWELSLQRFGLTDDLFVKMNARGKRLSRFDTFKSDLESKISKSHISDADKWKREIDNTYLDNFWAEFGKNNAEKNLFRTIIFYYKTLILIETPNAQLENEWEIDSSNVKYNDVINYIERKATIISICNILDNFQCWKSEALGRGLLVNQNDNEEKMLFYNEVILFGILHWFAKNTHMIIDYKYKQFFRILKNYVFSLRQADYKPRRQYSSSIDNKNISKVFEFVKKMIDQYDNTLSFNDYIKSKNYNELLFEKEKLDAIDNQQVSLNEIIDLEDLPFLKSNIHNFFFNGKIPLKATQLQQIFSDDNLINKSIRIIYSYSNDNYGKFNDLLFDPIGIQSGKKQLYYNDAEDQATGYFHKYSFRSDDFGDRILTSKGNSQYNEMSNCVRRFVTDLSVKICNGLSLQDSIENLLQERIANASFTDSKNIKWYIVKYKEFFYNNINTTISTLRRKVYGGIDIDNVYDIQCLDDNDRDFNQDHYQPFYLALSNLLNSHGSTITIDDNILKYKGVQIEYAHPCILSNGWKLRILADGNWEIDFSNNQIPNQNVLSQYGMTVNNDKCVLKNNGSDCILYMASFIEHC